MEIFVSQDCFLLLYVSSGTEILTVQAADNDDPKTDNVRIFYRLVGQIPESPRALFRVDRDSGVISVQADSMEGTASQYTLTITAEDAKGDFRSMQQKIKCLPHVVILTKRHRFDFNSSSNLLLVVLRELRVEPFIQIWPFFLVVQSKAKGFI